jgi:hypothetical protein
MQFYACINFALDETHHSASRPGHFTLDEMFSLTHQTACFGGLVSRPFIYSVKSKSVSRRELYSSVKLSEPRLIVKKFVLICDRKRQN